MKNKTTAALFAIFLGGIGVHKFYLGQAGSGIAHLLFCWMFIQALLIGGQDQGGILLSMNQDQFHTIL